MKPETFTYLWNEGISKAALRVMEDLPENVVAKYNVKLDMSDSKREKVNCEYDKLRFYVRGEFFNTGKDEVNKIDIHKICACITGALLKIRLISFDVGDIDTPEDVICSNYSVAFLASIYVLYLFVLSDYEKNGEYEYYNKLKQKATFTFPKTNIGHDPYIQGRIKTLALNDICGIDFDVLTYADMLFWIEIYNKKLIEEI